ATSRLARVKFSKQSCRNIAFASQIDTGIHLFQCFVTTLSEYQNGRLQKIRPPVARVRRDDLIYRCKCFIDFSGFCKFERIIQLRLAYCHALFPDFAPSGWVLRPTGLRAEENKIKSQQT